MFSLITLYLAPVIGFPWTMRIIGFISLVCCVVACLTLQTRPTTRPTEGKEIETRPKSTLIITLHNAIDLRPLAHDPAYLTTTLAIFLIEFAVFLPVTYISSAALVTGHGLPPQASYRLIALLNVGSVPGRALPGYLSDRLGRFNVMIVTALCCSVLIFCVWLPPTALDVTSEAALTVFAVLFGFWSGAAISLTPVCIAQVSEVGEIGRRVGTTFSISSFGALVGVPIGGAIVDASGGGYLGLVVFSGGCYVLALGAFVVARYVAGPKRLWAAY
jgi:predicted MFS family arabinose efflux permease